MSDIELSLDDWSKTKPEAMKLEPEQIAEIDAMIAALGAKCEEFGTSFYASFVTSVAGTGQSALHSRVGATMGTLTPEVWCAMFLATGGLDNLLDNMESLIECSNSRFEATTKLSIVTPSTSIILP